MYGYLGGEETETFLGFNLNRITSISELLGTSQISLKQTVDFITIHYCKQFKNSFFTTKILMLLFVQEKEKDHEYWPAVDAHDHITGKSRSNASADEEASLKL